MVSFTNIRHQLLLFSGTDAIRIHFAWSFRALDFYVRRNKFRHMKWSYRSAENASLKKINFFVKNIISTAHYIVFTNVTGTGVRIHYVKAGFAKGLRAYFRLAATPVNNIGLFSIPLCNSNVTGFYYCEFWFSFQRRSRKIARSRSLRRTSTVVPVARRGIAE